MIRQDDLVTKFDQFFKVAAYDESADRRYFPQGYEAMFSRYATETFLQGTFNGLMLNNTQTIERVYLIVFPAPQVLDKIIAKEVGRGAPGALIFSHHIADYLESGSGVEYIAEAQLQELNEHHISYYVVHAPLDCHEEISTSGALANALKLKDQRRFAPYVGGKAGVLGTVTPIGFHDFAKRVMEAHGLNTLRYNAIRHNGLAVNKVGVVAGFGGTAEFIRDAIEEGCDTFVTGEWWPFGPGEWRAKHRESIRTLLKTADINLIGTSHYASEAIVLREQVHAWLRENVPAVDPIFTGQDDPWR
ncbi:MAG: hypothetical protein OHK0023_18290 [Anaerolineae bacterium]